MNDEMKEKELADMIKYLRELEERQIMETYHATWLKSGDRNNTFF